MIDYDSQMKSNINVIGDRKGDKKERYTKETTVRYDVNEYCVTFGDMVLYGGVFF